MALSIKALRDKIQASQRQQSTSNYDSSSIFSFSKLNFGDQVRIRFVDDAEPNDFFWRVKANRTLRFDSIRQANGIEVNNRTFVSVPAFNIKKGDANLAGLPENYLYYSNDDVIQQRIKSFWDGTEEGRQLYNKFGRKESYVFQGFIRSEGYETKLYRFIINKDLFNVIYSFIDDDEIEHTPSDKDHGRDFILKVTKKIANINGKPTEVKDYSTSKWSSSETPLTEAENAWLANNEAFVLKNYIPSKPTVEQERVMLELFEASYNSEPYDVSRWSKMFKPDNIMLDENGNIRDTKDNKGATTQAREIPAPQPVVQNVQEVVQQPYVQQPMVQPQNMPTFVTPQPTQYYQPQPMVQQPVQQQYVQQPQYVAQPVQQPFVQPMEEPKMTAPQLIAQKTETVSGSNPNDVVNDILNKFKLNQGL